MQLDTTQRLTKYVRISKGRQLLHDPVASRAYSARDSKLPYRYAKHIALAHHGHDDTL